MKSQTLKLKDAIAKRIKELKEEKGLTQYQIFKKSGLPQSTISTIMNANTKTVEMSTIYQVCIGFDIEISDFFDCNYLKLENLED